ncbi:MAG: hypothetical protein H7Y04_03815, partial [Verrucomicrobia bacterium]|nr:hypothetical protein [Cytophagales bacterium]
MFVCQGLILSCFLLGSCTSYYRVRSAFNQNFERGNMEAAEKSLLKDKKGENRKTRFLHLLDLGVVTSMQGKYAESNAYFEKAYLLGEDYQKNFLDEAASFFVNPNFVEYKGEDFELLLIHYYKAINFLKLNQKQEALVEVRRMDIKLDKLSDKYQSASKFKKDAFVNLLMGVIYEANHEYNDAFIAYRNAVNIYENEYSNMFGMQTPPQLKQDLLRTAYLNNFSEDLVFWEKKFNLTYQPNQSKTGDVVFLWNNGLCPVKEQDGINFTIVHTPNG